MPVESVMDLYDTSVSVFGAPSRYVQGKQALDLIGKLASTRGQVVATLIDKDVVPLVQDRMQKSFAADNITATQILFEGELSPGTGARLAKRLSGSPKPEVVIGVGGGRAIDASKALTEYLGAALITVPTIASNDAPTSKNFVLYDANHELVEVRHLMRNPDFVLVDEGLIASAPKKFLASGIGDAIAKKFEADACARAGGKNMFAAVPTRTATAIAGICYQTLISEGVAAMQDAGTGRVTPALSATIEATILMAGLGFESGGLSLSHAMTRGLSKISGIKEAPHGLQVAYALLVQLKLEGAALEPELQALYHTAHLPMSLRALAGRQITDDEIRDIAQATEPVAHMKNFINGVKAAEIIDAMRTLEVNNHANIGAAE